MVSQISPAATPKQLSDVEAADPVKDTRTDEKRRLIAPIADESEFSTRQIAARVAAGCFLLAIPAVATGVIVELSCKKYGVAAGLGVSYFEFFSVLMWCVHKYIPSSSSSFYRRGF